jgi:hypothetical protein
MKYQVDQTSDGLKIEASVAPEQQAKLLEEFGKCASGTCSCPSTQYDKLASINVSEGTAGVSVELRAKPGENIDVKDIKQCLDHTANQLER